MSQVNSFNNRLNKDLSLIENNARMFATITSEANQIVPLLTQSFKMRIKGSSDLSFSFRKLKDAKDLGKWIEVRVDWEVMSRNSGEDFFVLEDVDTGYIYIFTQEGFKEHVTQVGLAPRMFNAWKSTL